MKISKVNHVRAGVSNNDKVEGILYDYPGKTKNGKKEIRAQVENVRNRAKALYTFFHYEKPAFRGKFAEQTRAKFEFVKPLLNAFDGSEGSVRGALISGDFWNIENADRMAKQESNLRALRFRYLDYTGVRENAVKDVVRKGLCQKLRKTFQYDGEMIYVPDVVQKIMLALANGQTLTEDVITANEMNAFLRAFNDDYYMAATYKTIVPSIEEQNVKVQIQDGKLVPVSALQENKAGMFAFMKQYCAADDSEKKKMLKHIRALILLYVSGEAVYREADDEMSDVSDRSFGTLLPEDNIHFSDLAVELLQQTNSLDLKDSLQKKMKRDLEARCQAAVWDSIIQKYKAAFAVEDLTQGDRYWLGYFENCAKKLLVDKKGLDYRHLGAAYVCNYIWKNFRSYLATKYIDMGKAVYYFSLNGSELAVPTGTVKYGEVAKKYENGFSSFDYERIKAQETFERGLSGYVLFAISNFSKSVLKEKNMDDALSKKIGSEQMEPDVFRKLLMYFGGKSSFENNGITEERTEELVNGIKDMLAIVRNGCFHFTSTVHSEVETPKIVRELFEKNLNDMSKVIRKKYYSNNVPNFYRMKEIDALIETLYRHDAVKPAQIPAFNNIISRPQLRSAMDQLRISMANTGNDPEVFRNSVYYVLKEIYYNDFLQQSDLVKLFTEAVTAIKKSEEEKDRFKAKIDAKSNKKHRKTNDLSATENFMEHMENILRENAGITFGGLCQLIMTEYNQQNNQKSMRPSAVKVKDIKGRETVKELENTKEIYKHFRTLLYKGILQAFITYVTKKQEYAFLLKPSYTEKVSESEFVDRNTSIGAYNELKSMVDQDPSCLSWFILTHFLNPAQANHLAGSLRNYIQFVEDIERRAKKTGNTNDDGASAVIKKAESILKVVDFTLPFCGQVTNTLTDYYKDEVDFAKHIAKFVNYEEYGKGVEGLKSFGKEASSAAPKQKTNSRGGGLASLSMFFPELKTEEPVTNIFYDGANPIVNRNAVLAMMFSQENILSRALKTIHYTDIEANKKLAEKLAPVFERGGCQTEAELKDLRLFQNHKNRIELVDTLIFSELINDLLGHLVSWSTLRERDLMYFQLGYAYIKLYHTDKIEETSYLRTLSNADMKITDGALLYQIAAMYTYDLPVWRLSEAGEVSKSDKPEMISKNVTAFCKEYCGRGQSFDASVYTDGLFFFEDIDEHDDVIALRNYIDHFRYFYATDRSLIDLYSEVYDRMLSYDLKLKKSVPVVLSNTLLRYFVNAQLSFNQKTNYTISERKKERIGAKISIERLETDYLTCKLLEKKGKEPENSKNGAPEKYMVEARTKEFIGNVKDLLCYPKNR